MTGKDWVLLTIAIAMLFLTAACALAETAFLRVNRVRALGLAEENRRGAKRLLKLVEHPERTINALILVIATGSLSFATLIGIVFERYGTSGVVISLLVEVTLFFVLAEAAPKTFAIQHGERVALAMSGFLTVVTNFLPLRVTAKLLIKVANVILPGKGLKEGPYVTEDEIRTMATVAADEDAIEREEQRLIHSIFEFGDTIVREVMVPRPDMATVEATIAIDVAVETAIGGGYSRMPAYEGSTDEIVGIVYLKDLIRRSRDGRGHEPVRSCIRAADFVPEQKRVPELLREMQQRKFHMAVVIDEYGGTAGLVTMEDLLEEIVGEIVDEYDKDEPSIEHLPDGSVRVPGQTLIHDVNETLDSDLPDDEWDTVGGLLLGVLGHVPAEGERMRFQGLEFAAERVQGRRIISVTVRPISIPDEDAKGEASPDTEQVAPHVDAETS